MIGGYPRRPPTARVSSEQRDAIREEVIWMLDIGSQDFRAALVQIEDFDDARRLRQHIEDWSALLDDLGWATRDPRQSFDLTLSGSVFTACSPDSVSGLERCCFGLAMESSQGPGEDAQSMRALIIAEACRDIRRSLPVAFDRTPYDCARRRR